MPGRTLGFFALALSLTVAGCRSHKSTTSVGAKAIPATTEPVYLATALACEKLRSDRARFTPLVVRGPGYSTTIQPSDGCRQQSSGPETQGASRPPWHWASYLYEVPMPASGRVRLTPGNQPAVTVDATKFEASHAATIYYVNCTDYYSDCPAGRGFQGRVTSIEYFKDEDVQEAP
jgi:hypothetical protein